MKTVPALNPSRPLSNLGYLSDMAIRALLRSFPPDADITVGDIFIKVASPQGEPVLSAARLTRNNWHVRARAGLITATYPQHLS
jgi:hypothetical protein